MAGQKIQLGFACLCLSLAAIVIVIIGCVEANVGTPTEIFNKTDLVGASATQNNPKVVGVKKHKNYEIVVYEYDDSGEKQKKSENGDDNSLEAFPILDHPTAPEPVPLKAFKRARSKPKPTASTTTTTTEQSPPEDDFERSSSDEASTSVESPEQEEEQEEAEEEEEPESEPPVTQKSSVSTQRNNKKTSATTTTTTAKPRLPQAFRTTTRKSSKTTSSPSNEEYSDEDEYSDEYDSNSANDRKTSGKSSKVDSKKETTRTGSGGSKKTAPKRFGGDNDEDYDDEYDDDDDYYEDGKRTSKRPAKKGTTTEAPARSSGRKGSGRLTPKPFFPLNDEDDDSDEYDDDNLSTISTRKPPSKSARPRLGSKSNVNRLSVKRKNVTESDDNDEEEAWGLDKSLNCKDPYGRKGVCQEYARCSIFYQELMDDYDDPVDPAEFKCRLPTQIGICCPFVSDEDVISDDSETPAKRKKGNYKPIKKKSKRRVINPQIRRLIRSNLNNSLDFGDFFLEDLNDIEQDLLSRSVQVTRNTPEFGHFRFFPNSKKIRQVSNIGLSLLQTSNDISERLSLTNEIGGRGLKNFKSSNIEALNDRCPFQRPCRTSKYRTADGSCNNLQKPKMGQSLTPLARILEPAYADGRWVPRVSVRGFELPSARFLSQTFIGDRNFPDNRYTLMVMQFGQFLDHDLTSVPVFTFANNSGINCCRNGQFLSPELRHPNCFPIEIPASDPFYSRFGQRCMNFVRSRMAPRIDCSLGYADQMNALTHWIDASNIYGSTDDQMRQLRLFQGGLLRFSELGDGKMLLPVRNTGPNGGLDYRAGDDRVNEMQGLMIMHLIWFREHNRIAFELARINPFWNDEELFQEARRILTAEYQHVIYNEWLPIIIGRKYMEKAGIVPLTKGYYKGYDSRIDSSIANAFSVAAFRMGHTLVQGIVRLIDELGRDSEMSVISQNDVNAGRTRQPNQVDKWLRGMAQQPIQSFDPFITEHLNGRLFQGTNGAFGMDLSSLNIQRSRDHGVPGYNFYRELCQVGRRARSFDEYKDWIPPETVDKMSLYYAHPDDVDLWIGGINERSLPGALVGPTFACIIGDQFTRSKKGDRYFYDIADQPHSFSPEQLREIRKVTFARIFCENGDDLEALQPAALLQADFDFNSLVDCKRSTRIPRMNLRLWEKEPTPDIGDLL